MRLTVGRKLKVLLVAVTVLLIAVRPFAYIPVNALVSELPNRYLKLSDSVVSDTNVLYTLGFDTSATYTIGSIELEICINDPFPGTSCTVPVGLDVSGSTLVSQTGTNDFTIDLSNTNPHRIVFTRTPSSVNASSFMFEINKVINPANPGSVYGRIRIFTGSSLGGSVNNAAGIAFNINGNFLVSTQVPPHIDLCAGVTVADDCSSTVGDRVDFGNLSTSGTAKGTSQFASATNATNGYTVSVIGNSMTSGNNVITRLSSMSISTAGVNQFGMNLRQNIFPAQGADPTGLGTAAPIGNYAIPDNFTYNNGDTIVSANGPDNYRKFTVSYILNINNSQPAGYYATTLTFVALGSF